MSLQSPTDALKAANNDGNEFSSRSEYLAQKAKEREERARQEQKASTQLERQTSENKGENRDSDKKELKDISSSLKTIQSILKGMSVNSERYLKAISKKLDSKTAKLETLENKMPVKEAPPTPVPAGSSKDKILTQKYLAATAIWQKEITALLKKAIYARGDRVATRKTTRSRKSPGESKGFLADFAKYIATALLGVGAGALVGTMVGAVTSTITKVLGGVASAILATGKLAVTGFIAAGKLILTGIASAIVNIGKGAATAAGAVLSKLAAVSSDFLKSMASKGVDIAKKAGTAIKDVVVPKAKVLAKSGAATTKKLVSSMVSKVKEKAPQIARKSAQIAKSTWVGTKTVAKGIGSAFKQAPLYGGAALDTAKDMLKTSSAAKMVTDASAKMGTKGVAKTVGKAVLKKIPFVGAAIGVGLGAQRAMHGDWKGAAAEVGSGVASTVPGIGTAASIGTDVWLAKRDMDLALDKRLKTSKPVIAPMTQHLESTQQRSTELLALKEKQQTVAPVVQAVSTTNNVKGGQEMAPRLSARNTESTADFLRKLSLSSTMQGQGFIIN